MIIIRGESTSVRGSVKLVPGEWYEVCTTWRSSDGKVQVFQDGAKVGESKVATGKQVTGGIHQCVVKFLNLQSPAIHLEY